jgi:hypothetical protein
MRKPSVAAWAVNQLVRTQPNGIQALFQAGDDLAAAQAGAAAGQKSGDAMRDATRRQREAVGQLLEAAEGLLSAEGQALSQTTLERVGDTLRAAAVDEEARRQVEGGCLTHELRFVGVGIGGLSARVTTPRPAKKAAPEKEKAAGGPRTKGTDKAKKAGAERRSEEKKAAAEPRGEQKRSAGERRAEEKAEAARRAEAQRVAEAEREAERERAVALKSARRAEAEARRTATRAEKERAAAQARREDAAASLEEAERLLTAAEQRAEQTAADLARAEQALRDLTEA